MLSPESLLSLLQQRRSRRRFSPEPLTQDQLAPLFEAARTAPSATNRQPWRYRVILNPAKKEALVGAVRARVEALRAALSGSEYLDELRAYSDHFYEPLEAAPALIFPLWRPFPDTIDALARRAGQPPGAFSLAEMPSELCAVAAATMNLLLMAEARGLACCWMAGPMIASSALIEGLQLVAPWRLLGAIAVGHPAPGDAPAPPRKPLERIVEWDLP